MGGGEWGLGRVGLGLVVLVGCAGLLVGWAGWGGSGEGWGLVCDCVVGLPVWSC